MDYFSHCESSAFFWEWILYSISVKIRQIPLSYTVDRKEGDIDLIVIRLVSVLVVCWWKKVLLVVILRRTEPLKVKQYILVDHEHMFDSNMRNKRNYAPLYHKYVVWEGFDLRNAEAYDHRVQLGRKEQSILSMLDLQSNTVSIVHANGQTMILIKTGSWATMTKVKVDPGATVQPVVWVPGSDQMSVKSRILFAASQYIKRAQ